MGEIGLSPKQFWRLTPAEFEYTARGYRRRELAAWQQTRWLGALLVNINRGKDDPAVAPHELMPLPGDPLPSAPAATATDLAETLARLDQLDADLLA